MDIFTQNSRLIVSVFRLSDALHAPARRSFCILNLIQAVRADLYAKMEMLLWICDIYR